MTKWRQATIPGLTEALQARWVRAGLPRTVLPQAIVYGSFVRGILTDEPWNNINLIRRTGTPPHESRVFDVHPLVRPIATKGDGWLALARRMVFTVEECGVAEGEVRVGDRFFEHLAQRLLVPVGRSRLRSERAWLQLFKLLRAGYCVESRTLLLMLQSSSREGGVFTMTAEQLFEYSGGAVVA